MSQSPSDATAETSVASEDPFIRNIVKLNIMMNHGLSFSGHERNCCFLNTGSGRFANISAVSGFDFPDDGRGVALCDWDHDGDLDVWLSNRTAPRVRFLRNDCGRKQHYVAIRLIGTRCNRDAIGARLTLTLADEESRPIVQAVRAGEGFLSQSSKWVHFGLGSHDKVERVTVRWPGGDEATFTGLRADARYQITQGQDSAERWQPPRTAVDLVAGPTRPPANVGPARALLTTRWPMPPLPYETSSKTDAILPHSASTKPLLVNLWASWCQPCLKELADFSHNEQAIREAGLDVIALAVDGLDEETSYDPVLAQRLLDDLGFPFEHGRATPELLDKLEIIHNQLFGRYRQLPVPTSLLINTDGRLAAMYKGTVSVEQVIEDLQVLPATGMERVAAALPFPGRWSGSPPALGVTPMLFELLDQGYHDDLMGYVVAYKTEIEGDRSYPKLLRHLAQSSADQGESERAVNLYREALSKAPGEFQWANDLGKLLMLRKEVDEAIQQFRSAVEANPQFAEAHNNLGLALRSQRAMVEAIEHFQKAVEARPDFVDGHLNLGMAMMLERRLDEAETHFRQVLRLEPDNVEAHNNLGILLGRQGQTEKAIEHFRQAIAAKPDYIRSHHNLGIALRSAGRLDEAIAKFREVLERAPNYRPAEADLQKTLRLREQPSATR